MAHAGTNQIKQSRIELLIRKYELFEKSDKETVMDMYTRFTYITPRAEIIREILYSLKNW